MAFTVTWMSNFSLSYITNSFSSISPSFSSSKASKIILRIDFSFWAMNVFAICISAILWSWNPIRKDFILLKHWVTMDLESFRYRWWAELIHGSSTKSSEVALFSGSKIEKWRYSTPFEISVFLIHTVGGYRVDHWPALHICVARLGVNFLVSQWKKKEPT